LNYNSPAHFVNWYSFYIFNSGYEEFFLFICPQMSNLKYLLFIWENYMIDKKFIFEK